jgi:hypothetical protein
MIYNIVIEAHPHNHHLTNSRFLKTKLHFIPPLFIVAQKIRSEGLVLLYGRHTRVASTSGGVGKLREYTHKETCKLSLRPVKPPYVENMATFCDRTEFLHMAQYLYDPTLCVVYRDSDDKDDYHPYEVCDQ